MIKNLFAPGLLFMSILLHAQSPRPRLVKVKNLTSQSVGLWEPSYDTELWKQKHILNLFVQKVEQGDGEQLKDIPAQPVSVLEWNPGWD